MKVFRDRWEFELEIVRHIIPDPGAFEEGPEKAIPDIQQLVQIMLRQRDFENLMRRHGGARYRLKSVGTYDQPVGGGKLCNISAG